MRQHTFGCYCLLIVSSWDGLLKEILIIKTKIKMENQIYRINMDNNVDLEFFVIGSNEVNPYKSIREMAVQMIIGEKQLDASLDLNELASLIKYLTDCKDYIIKYNEASVPEIEET